MINKATDGVDEKAPLHEQIADMYIYMDGEIPRHIPPVDNSLFVGGKHGNYLTYVMFDRSQIVLGYNVVDHGMFEEDIAQAAQRYVSEHPLPEGAALLTPNNEGYDTISLTYPMDKTIPLKDIDGFAEIVKERLEVLESVVKYIFNKEVV